jgi:hypothetical protein
MIGNENYPKKPLIYICQNCDFKTSNKKDYNRHTQTKKHFSNEKQGSAMKITPKNPSCKCVCGKTYVDKSGLWRHKQKCINNDIIEQCDGSTVDKELVDKELVDKELVDKEMIILLLNQNTELQKQIIEMSKVKTININNNTHKININVFLNEQCKDALNITEFIHSIKLQLYDLENTGRIGFVEGMSKIFIRELQELDVHKRPVHCSDLKREVLYIKDDDQWSKENDTRDKIILAIKQLAYKNFKQISKWIECNPDCKNPESKKSDQYNKMLCNIVSGGTTDENNKNYSKIIKNVTKEVLIGR